MYTSLFYCAFGLVNLPIYGYLREEEERKWEKNTTMLNWGMSPKLFNVLCMLPRPATQTDSQVAQYYYIQSQKRI